jgi:hypothetical protein
MVDMLGNTALKFDFRLQVHDFLASSFMIAGSCVPLSGDQLEQQICCKHFGPRYAPEERDHLIETELMLVILLQRIPVIGLPSTHSPTSPRTATQSGSRVSLCSYSRPV